jgi:hypothetical protein
MLEVPSPHGHPASALDSLSEPSALVTFFHDLVNQGLLLFGVEVAPMVCLVTSQLALMTLRSWWSKSKQMVFSARR